MKQLQKSDLSIFLFEWLAQFPELTHFVTARSGGSSEGSYESLNLGLHVGDEKKKLLKTENYWQKS